MVRRTLFAVVLVAGPLLAAPAESRVVANCPNAEGCSVSGTLVLRAVDDESVRKVPIVRGVAQFDAGTKTWEVDLEANGWWMARQRLVPGATLNVPVWRTTRVHGRFTLQPPATGMPKTFTILAETPPGTKGATIATGSSFECPVAVDGSWTCALPATALDLTLRAKTFTPEYRWNVKVPQVPDFGTVVLKQGASFVAWLDSRTVKALKQPAHARLLRLTMSASPTLGDRLNQPVADSAFNPRGMVQLAPVPPGMYTLEVTAPGFASFHMEKIEIYERSESKLRMPVRLEPPLTIRLTLDPPRDPAGAQWQLTVFRANELTSQMTRVAEGTAADGAFTVDGQGPGHYTVDVADVRGNRYASRKLDIRGDADAQQTIEIGALRLRGTVTAAKQPIAAQLWFGGRNGAERVHAEADSDGRFHVILPRAGKWNVDVENKEAGVLAAKSITIDQKQDELSIDLPSTELRGWVRDQNGQRAKNAVITLVTSTGVLTQRAEADGTFRFRGVSAGAAMIHAVEQRTHEESRLLNLTIAEESRMPDLELVLEDRRPLKGVVRSEGQPLIGARVTGYGYSGGGALSQRAVSGLDGGFELSFPASATEIVLIVSAPGRTLQAFSMPPGDRPVVLDVAPAGGTLRLHFSAGASRPVLYFNGAPIPAPDLLDWARAQDPSQPSANLWTVANVAPGPYRFCLLRQGTNVCRDGLLARGGVLNLGTD